MFLRRKMFCQGGKCFFEVVVVVVVVCFVRENNVLLSRKRFWGEKCFEVENVLSKEIVFEVHPKLLAAVDVAWPTFQLHAPLDWSIKAVAFCLFKLKLKKKGVPGRSLQKGKNTEYLDIGWCIHGMLCFEILIKYISWFQVFQTREEDISQGKIFWLNVCKFC